MMNQKQGIKFIFNPTLMGLKIKGETSLFPVGKIYCVGKNYLAHAEEMGSVIERDEPFFFSKPPQALTHFKKIPYPPKTNNLHHEVELVVCLSKGGSNISQEEAKEMIFGYAVGVDLTRRDLQKQFKDAGEPWDLSKGFDDSAPISEIVQNTSLLADAKISLKVNDEQRQSSNISEMVWGVGALISHLSQYITLKPGDIIFTGTPAGVGPLNKNDVVFAEIEGVGHLEFTMV